MSADFWSFAQPLSSERGAALYARLRPHEAVSDVRGPDDVPCHRFDRDGAWVDPSVVARAYGGRNPPVEIGAAYVDAPFDEIESLDDPRPASSPNYASLVALDRAVALPTGTLLLGGRALRLLDPLAVRDLDAALGALLDPGALARVARYLDRWGNGPRDADEVGEVLRSGVARALDAQSSLLLIGCVVP